MATPAQVANDLRAQAKRLHRTGHADLVKSLERGAEIIHRQSQIIAELEAAAQAEADRYEAYVNGNDPHA
ncbi:MAG: hypothetical protein ACK4TM_06370 [Yoonia sp.]